MRGNTLMYLCVCVHVAYWSCLMCMNFTLYFRRIAEGLELCLPNLETLVLTGNLILELADLDPLANMKSLRTLSLLHNPVTTRQHYRLYVAFKLPHLRLLDFRKIKMKVSEFWFLQHSYDEQWSQSSVSNCVLCHGFATELLWPVLSVMFCSPNVHDYLANPRGTGRSACIAYQKWGAGN